MRGWKQFQKIAITSELKVGIASKLISTQSLVQETDLHNQNCIRQVYFQLDRKKTHSHTNKNGFIPKDRIQLKLTQQSQRKIEIQLKNVFSQHVIIGKHANVLRLPLWQLHRSLVFNTISKKKLGFKNPNETVEREIF